MLRWAVIFLVVAIVAGILGFAGLMVAAAGIAKLLFYLFLILFLLGDGAQLEIGVEVIRVHCKFSPKLLRR